MPTFNFKSAIAALLVTGAISILILHARLSPTLPPPVERMWPVMGTFASVTLRSNDSAMIDEVRDEAARILEEVNARMSVYIPESEISQLNTSTNPVTISPLTRDMLFQARHYTQISEGAFDPTCMPLIRLWGFSGGNIPDALPTADQIATARQLTGISKLEILDHTARFSVPGMTLDLGGIAKGFAVDCCYDTIVPKWPVNAIFNLGGNIRVHGMARQDRPWRIGVQHPFERNKTLGTLLLDSGMALATSGNYERFVTINGRRYAHIIDPRTGLPVEGMAGITVLSATATEADALSTALFVLGIDKAAAVLSRTPGTQALLVPDRLPVEIYVSKGMLARFHPHPDFANCINPLPDTP